LPADWKPCVRGGQYISEATDYLKAQPKPDLTAGLCQTGSFGVWLNLTEM